MSIFGSNPSYPFSVSKAANQTNQQRQANQQSSQAALQQYLQYFQNTMMPYLGQSQNNLMQQFQTLAAPYMAQVSNFLQPFSSGQNKTDMQSFLNSELANIETGRADAKKSNQQTFDDQVRLGGAAVSDSLTRRGLGSSTLKESGEQGIRANALGSLMNANTAVDQAYGQRRAGLAGQGLSAMGQADNNRLGAASIGSNFAQSMFGKQFGIPEAYQQLMIQFMANPQQFAADRTVIPGVLYPEKETKFDAVNGMSPSSNPSLFGGLLSSLGGSLFGGMGGALGGLGGNLFSSLFGGGSSPYMGQTAGGKVGGQIFGGA